MTAVIGYGNLIESATITTTGTWSGTYPAANVQTPSLGEFARTTVSTSMLKMDLGSVKTIGLIGIAGIVAPAGAEISFQYSNDNFVSNFAFVTTSPEYIFLSQYGLGSSFFLIVPNIASRYWGVQLYWSGAPQFDIGRVFIGSAFKPEYGLSFGASSGFESRTGRQESASGRRFHRKRTPRRVVNGVFEYLSNDEGHLWQQIQESHDISEEHVLIWDDEDSSTKRGMRNFLCNADELGPMEYPYATERKIGVKFSEVIA